MKTVDVCMSWAFRSKWTNFTEDIFIKVVLIHSSLLSEKPEWGKIVKNMTKKFIVQTNIPVQ